MVFQEYANYYDALYRDKDYRAECLYLERIFRKCSSRPVEKVLDLGCGTGGHALLLAKRGYRVTGIDLSGPMLTRAGEKARRAGVEISFHRGDVRTFRLRDRFDAVISMFAVMGYQTGDQDVERALAAAARHLRKGGVLAFDVWFGPAVLHSPPGRRKKEVEDAEGRIVRLTTCSLDLLEQVVTVRFRTSFHRGGQVLHKADESHRMRFFFPREIALLLKGAGLKQRLLVPFRRLRGRPHEGSWTVMVVAEKA